MNPKDIEKLIQNETDRESIKLMKMNLRKMKNKQYAQDSRNRNRKMMEDIRRENSDLRDINGDLIEQLESMKCITCMNKSVDLPIGVSLYNTTFGKLKLCGELKSVVLQKNVLCSLFPSCTHIGILPTPVIESYRHLTGRKENEIFIRRDDPYLLELVKSFANQLVIGKIPQEFCYYKLWRIINVAGEEYISLNIESLIIFQRELSETI